MQNELPEWAKMKAFEVQSAAIKECQDNRLFVIADYPFVTGAAKEVLDKHLAQALVAAERRGIERAADIAEGFDGGAGTNPWGWPDRIAAAIRQLGEAT